MIQADPSQIQEVLINLCNNAMQAMEEKGEIKIALKTVDLKTKDIPAQYNALPGHFLNLRVQDNGCGMSAEMLDFIFDPFYTTKEDYEGAGMGLATVQGIVAQHGGVIKVDSMIDQGTTFNLYFPIIDDTPEITKEEQDPSMPQGHEHILFVDDDPMFANTGGQMLKEKGYTVSTMTDSSEALKLFTAKADHFDLVITDQTMPELTGIELIDEVKKIRPDIPTILCSGFSSKIDEDNTKELEADAFLMKPLDLPKLLQTIRQVLDESKVQ
jgi:CheY-like chemotaxis protein